MQIDAIFVNSRIRTMDPARPTATRLGVLNGRVVGLDEELDGVSAAVTHDLGGAPVLPGFHDAHFHTHLLGRRLAWLDLRASAVGDLDELYRAVAERAAGLGPDEWVFGSGYDQNKTGGHPVARALDEAAGGRPVWLEHVSGHMGVANTEAFRRIGYADGRGVPDVDGGHVARLADGTAEGLLQERAMQLVYSVIRPLPTQEVLDHVRLASDKALSQGLTSVTEPGLGAHEMIGASPSDVHTYQLARERGLLRLRTTLMPYITKLHYLEGFRNPREWFGLDLGIRTGFGDDRMRLGPVKIVTDGSLIGKSAAMHTCYHGEPSNKGFMQFTAEEVRDFVVDAHRAGWSVAAHAIGDSAVDAALDAFEAAQLRAPRGDARHRIEHFGVASDEQVARLVRLGVVPVPQGAFVSELGDGMLRALGPERARLCYRMKSLLEAGAVLPGSSDAPVADGNPLVNIHDMVNRVTAGGEVFNADERLTVAEAVRAYTYGSAYAVGEEGDKGVLARGMLADLVVLSDDLFAVDPSRIRDVTVGATVVGGAVEFDGGAVRTL
ncbi:amidohydrolase [Streptomyces tagetis]|uniref:Amidohydrolase n=1 Tax=Streptomyces tagetis TaxID=2820809 RepID=A0A940XCU6_9ACTN|nr:amidohydrolase [Streptomyces sp. RG38]MBQ0826189.1 amidohydrolase [Streptomyces sp. RG38]